VSDYFISLHGVMKFEKEPSACEEVRRSIKPSAFANRVPSRKLAIADKL